jgi:methyl-accepting chemotaxis protein
MNPDINRDGTTVSTLMLWETIGSVGIPVISLIIAAIISYILPDRAFLIYILAGFAVFIVAVVIPLNSVIQRTIRERMSGLADVCRDFVGGDQTVRAVVSGEDEFGVLASSLNMLLDSHGGSAGSSLGGANSNDAVALQAQIEKLLQEVSAVGDGDLRVQAEVTPDTLGVLADSFNYMIEELAKVVGRVQSTAVQVTNATRRILDRSAELALASDTQVKQIAQTTEAVEALANFIQNVARNAQLSVEAAQEALKNAASGQEAVRQTIDGMMVIRENVQETAKKIKRLGERSNEIGEIVRIIEDIADQTNLLALNAAIQSAMAGEHGRGFAVVADEIRLLAERSTESTKRIATLVKSIQGDTYEAVVAMEDSTQEVVKGSQLADDAGRSLNSILTAVERQAKMIEDIARAANEQTSVSEAVAVTMSRISEITRQTDAGAQEAAVSVSYLAELSEQLRASVSTFQLPERTNDVLGSFSQTPSVAEVPDARNNQSFSPVLSSGSDVSWSGFGGNFPPLPEPNSAPSLVPMSSQPNPVSFVGNGQQDFGRMTSFGSNSGPLPQNARQNNLSNYPSFNSFGGAADSQQLFGGQQDLTHMDNQFSFNAGFSDASFGTTPPFGASPQSPSPSNPGEPNPASQQMFGQSFGSFGAGTQSQSPSNLGGPNPAFQQPFGQPFGAGTQSQSPSNPGMPSPASQQAFGQSPTARQRWQGPPPKDQKQ